MHSSASAEVGRSAPQHQEYNVSMQYVMTPSQHALVHPSAIPHPNLVDRFTTYLAATITHQIISGHHQPGGSELQVTTTLLNLTAQR